MNSKRSRQPTFGFLARRAFVLPQGLFNVHFFPSPLYSANQHTKQKIPRDTHTCTFGHDGCRDRNDRALMLACVKRVACLAPYDGFSFVPWHGPRRQHGASIT
jgi:hypothetical protein